MVASVLLTRGARIGSTKSAARDCQSVAPSAASHEQPVDPSRSVHAHAADAAHTTPQRPHEEFVVVLVSQPLAGFPSQSPQPGSQEPTVHSPRLHPEVPLAMGDTTCAEVQSVASPVPHLHPHWPQLSASCWISISQPSVIVPSQS